MMILLHLVNLCCKLCVDGNQRVLAKVPNHFGENLSCAINHLRAGGEIGKASDRGQFLACVVSHMTPNRG